MNVRAFMGGTFDPVHFGHLRIAERVRESLELSELSLLPTAVPPHKPSGTMSPAFHRVGMLRLALHAFPKLTICTLELGGNVTYTVDTLRSLRDGPPPIRPVFVVGMDSVVDLPSWHAYEDLLREFDLVAVARPHHPDRAVAGLAPSVAERLQPSVPPQRAARLIEDEDLGAGGRIFPIELPTEPVSSREVRRRVAAGEALTDLVPAEIARYIQLHGLYQ